MWAYVDNGSIWQSHNGGVSTAIAVLVLLVRFPSSMLGIDAFFIVAPMAVLLVAIGYHAVLCDPRQVPWTVCMSVTMYALSVATTN